MLIEVRRLNLRFVGDLNVVLLTLDGQRSAEEVLSC